MITEFGNGLLYGDASLAKVNLNKLTNAQRAVMGLPPRISRQRGPADNTEMQEREAETLRRDIATGKIAPASVRLAEQLREMLGKWAMRGIQ